MKKRLHLLIAVSLALVPSIAQSVLIVSEGFSQADYGVGNIDGDNFGFGFSGAWNGTGAGQNGIINVPVVAYSLQTPTDYTVGNAPGVIKGTVDGDAIINATYYRPFSGIDWDSGDTYWLSYSIQQSNSGLDVNDLMFVDSTFSPQMRIGIREDGTFGSRDGGLTGTNVSGLTLGNQFFILARITTSNGGTDTVDFKVYQDPATATIGAYGDLTWDASVSGTVSGATIGLNVIMAGFAQDFSQMDNLVIGKDATPGDGTGFTTVTGIPISGSTVTVSLETSTDLINWVPADEGDFLIPTGEQRFFRARIEPN